MKKLIQLFAILLIFLSADVNGKDAVDRKFPIEEIKVPVYVDDESGQKLKLTMSYGSAVIQNPQAIAELKNARIGTIDVVCTDDPAGANFSGLTKNRVESVRKIFPEANDENITWRFFRQTGCSDKSSAEKLFHGVVITYRPAQTKESMKKEIEYLSRLTESDRIENYTLVPTELTAATFAITDTSYSPGRDTTYITTYSWDTLSEKSGTMKFVPFVDSTVSAVLNRQHWKNMSVTADVTGSMYPYTAQLLLWLELNTKDSVTKQFTFFNDGDMTPDNLKVIGRTGGIYSDRLSDFRSVKNLATKAMSNGGGGDAPENDVEALRKSIKLCPECEHILIADNWAPLKDTALLGEITKPVRIVLCGTQWGVNTDYLNLARATGGSVHTMEKDLTDLAGMHEGAEVSIGKESFRIINGRFVKVVRS